MRAEAQKARIIEEHERFIAESLRLAEQARLAKKKRVVEWIVLFFNQINENGGIRQQEFS